MNLGDKRSATLRLYFERQLRTGKLSGSNESRLAGWPARKASTSPAISPHEESASQSGRSEVVNGTPACDLCAGPMGAAEEDVTPDDATHLYAFGAPVANIKA